MQSTGASKILHNKLLICLHNLSVTFMNNKTPKAPFNTSQSRASIQIENIVKMIENTSEPAFHITESTTGYEHIELSSLSELFFNIQHLLSIHTDHYEYSEHLKLFWRACSEVGLERSPVGPVCLDPTGLYYLSFHSSMNELVNRVRQLTREPGYRRKASDRSYQARQREADVETYARAVLNRYSRTVVVRVDLHYLEIVDPLLRIEDLFRDLATLIRSRERNPIFEYETGYIWSVEQGKNKGFHIHTAFFFNSAHVYSDWHKAQEIGALWEKITGGRGYFFNCNADKLKYTKLGIGTIKRADTQACENVINTMRYLAKEEQHLRIKPTRARAFGMGHLPR